MHKSFVISFLLVLSLCFELSANSFPIRPDQRITPGKLCDRPSSFRYKAHIPYCERDVSYDLKQSVFEHYRSLGYFIDLSRRSDYKIDHYIPLCAGGSNDFENLWPQHRSIYKYTDQLEALVCERLKEDILSHEQSLYLIVYVKNDLSKLESVMEYLYSLEAYKE